MLQTHTIQPRLLELLDRIMLSNVFEGFNLVGGTALALQIGHRLSIDIDLFGNQEIREDEFVAELSTYGHVIKIKKSEKILVLSVDGIKVDFVNYNYPNLESPKIIENIRIASVKDIAAMKLNAIAGRGSKKDFIDLYFLIQHYELKEILKFYSKKFPDGSEFMVIKSLSYFEDADKEEMPIMLSDVGWQQIKEVINRETSKLE